jgi:hypothetical protein
VTCGADINNAGLCRVSLDRLAMERVLPGDARISMVVGGTPFVVSAAPRGADELWTVSMKTRELVSLSIPGQDPHATPDGRILYTERRARDPVSDRAVDVLNVWSKDRGLEAVDFVPPGPLFWPSQLDDGSILVVEFRGPEYTQNSGADLARYAPDGTRSAIEIAPQGEEVLGVFPRGRYVAIRYGGIDQPRQITMFDLDRLLGGNPPATRIAEISGWHPIAWADAEHLIVVKQLTASDGSVNRSRVGVLEAPTFTLVELGTITPAIWQGVLVDHGP